MRNRCRFVLLLALQIALSIAAQAPAKTPEQLKAEFTRVLPSGTRARVAWLKGGQKGYNGSVTAVSRSVWVVDSDDGVVRRLTNDATMDIWDPCITRDGTRVIFIDMNRGSVFVVNWDGSGTPRKVFDTGCEALRYWHDPVSGKDYALIDDGGAYRVNIDNPSDRVLLWNKTVANPTFFGTLLSTDEARLRAMDIAPFTLSPDGLYITGHFPHPILGLAQVGNGTFTVLDTGSCFSSIAPDQSHDVLFQTGEHLFVRIVRPDGSVASDINTTQPILDWARANNGLNGCDNQLEYDYTRWSNHRNFVTYSMYSTTVNPIIMRLSDQDWVGIEDIGCTWAGSTDMRLFNADLTTLTATPVVPITSNNDRPIAKANATFSIDGRIVTAGSGHAANVVVDPSGRYSVSQSRHGSVR